MAVPRERTPGALLAFLGKLPSGKNEKRWVDWYLSGGVGTLQRSVVFIGETLTTTKARSVDLQFTRLDLAEDVNNYKGGGMRLRSFYLAELGDMLLLRCKAKAEQMARENPGNTVCYDGSNGYWRSLLAHIEQFLEYVESGKMPDSTKRAGPRGASLQARKRKAKAAVQQDSNVEDEECDDKAAQETGGGGGGGAPQFAPVALPVAQAVPLWAALNLQPHGAPIATAYALPLPAPLTAVQARKEAAGRREPPSEHVQVLRAAGTCQPLIRSLKDAGKFNAPGPRQWRGIRDWLKTDAGMKWMRACELDPLSVHLDHAAPRGGMGAGIDSVFNCCFLPGSANGWFGNLDNEEKRRYIGPQAVAIATRFSNWATERWQTLAKRDESLFDQSQFDPHVV